jgi:class 3 adenylate cyclase
MRIGIHTGSIIGGVLGTEIVRYDIYGPDVLIANKMESKGERGKLQVSQSTKDLLEQYYPEEFKYTFHTTVDIPSIDRSTDGYFINFKTYDEPSMDI